MVHIYKKKYKKSFQYLTSFSITTNISIIAYAASYDSPKDITNINYEYCQKDANNIANTLVILNNEEFVKEIAEMNSE